MVKEQRDYFQEMLLRAQTNRAGAPIEELGSIFTDYHADEMMTPPQRGDREPDEAELFFDRLLSRRTLPSTLNNPSTNLE